jgi:hypothetical protein
MDLDTVAACIAEAQADQRAFVGPHVMNDPHTE